MSKSLLVGALAGLALVALVWNIGPARNIVFPAVPRIGA